MTDLQLPSEGLMRLDFADQKSDDLVITIRRLHVFCFTHQKSDEAFKKKCSSVATSVTDENIPEGDLRRCCVWLLRYVPEMKMLVV